MFFWALADYFTGSRSECLQSLVSIHSVGMMKQVQSPKCCAIRYYLKGSERGVCKLNAKKEFNFACCGDHQSQLEQFAPASFKTYGEVASKCLSDSAFLAQVEFWSLEKCCLQLPAILQS